MPADVVQQKVFQVVADVFNLPVDQVTAASSPETIEAWDSVQHLNLVLSLEGTLGFQFTPEEIANIKNVGDALALVREKIPA